MASVVQQPIWCRWGCRYSLHSLLSLYPLMLLMTMRVMGVFQQPLCCCRCCCCCCWLWFTGLTLQCCWWRWGCRVYFNNRCGFLALQSYESCLVLRRSRRLSCVNKRFISGSSWAWWRWWYWWLEGLCVSLCRVDILRSIPFVMSGHLIFIFLQMLGTPIFNTNPNSGYPKRIYQHSGQAHKHSLTVFMVRHS